MEFSDIAWSILHPFSRVKKNVPNTSNCWLPRNSYLPNNALKRNDCSQPHNVKKEKNNILKALYSLGAPGIIDVETYLPSDDWTRRRHVADIKFTAWRQEHFWIDFITLPYIQKSQFLQHFFLAGLNRKTFAYTCIHNLEARDVSSF